MGDICKINIEDYNNTVLDLLKGVPECEEAFNEFMNKRQDCDTYSENPEYKRLMKKMVKLREKAEKVFQESGFEFTQEWEDIETQIIGIIEDEIYRLAFKDGMRFVIMALVKNAK